jgi:hypothetical protein
MKSGETKTGPRNKRQKKKIKKEEERIKTSYDTKKCQ